MARRRQHFHDMLDDVSRKRQAEAELDSVPFTRRRGRPVGKFSPGRAAPCPLHYTPMKDGVCPACVRQGMA